MKIQGTPALRAELNPSLPKPPSEKPSRSEVDSFEHAETSCLPRLPLPSTRKPEVNHKPTRLPAEPAPKLDRPVLFVHGYMGVPEEFQEMTSWLTREGANRDGGVLDGADPGPVDPNANLFAIRYTRPWQTMETDAQELHNVIEAICKATGATGVDVVAHSKGALDTRKYLMESNEKVDHVVMIGTPNAGTFLADVELLIRDKLGIPVKPPIKDPEVQAALNQLRADRVDGGGIPRNPALRELNQNWETQRNRAEFLAITGNGIPTINEVTGLTFLGDGTVTRRSAAPEGIPARHAWFSTHGSLAGNHAVMRETFAFLTGQPLSATEDIFETPEDRARAMEMGLDLDTNVPVSPSEGFLLAESAQEGRGKADA
ncbi:MAG: esterase/lipase family protein [Candidatus Xenobium sp.]|nr:hypothetical protein [Burkholderiales bacterium]